MDGSDAIFLDLIVLLLDRDDRDKWEDKDDVRKST